MFGTTQILPLPAPPLDGNLGPTPPAQVVEEPKDERMEVNEEDNNKADKVPTSVATHTRTIGIINPPPDISIVDKTSQFVAKNGPEFEKRIVLNNAGNAKFNFLNASDPYHAYYQHRLAEARAQNHASGEQPTQPENKEAAPAPPTADGAEATAKPDPSAQFRPFRKVLEPPEAEQYVLMPPKGLTDKLQKSSADMTTVLERCLHRLEWERDFADDEDQDLPPPMTLEEVIRRSKMPTLEEEEYVEPVKEVEMEMDEEEAQLLEEGMRAATLEENGGVKSAETMAIPEEQDPPMRIVKNWKRPEERIAAERDPTKYVVSPITGELIPINEMSEHMRISLIDPKYKEQKDRMFAKIKETTLAHDDEISRNIVGLARTRPDIFGTTEEEVSNAVKAEIEKKMEGPKQVIWDGHTGSIGRTANQAMSQNNADDQNDATNDARNLPGPQAPPPPRPGLPSVRPLPPPPGLALNIPRPPNTVQYSTPTSAGVAALPPPRPPMVNMIPQVRPPPPPMPQMPGQQNLMVNRPPMPPSMSMNSHSLPIPPPPGSQFTPLGAPRPFVPHPMSQPGMSMLPPPPMPQGMPPPPPPEEAPPLPEEPKRQKLDESVLIPEDQFLAQHSGPARINVSVPNAEEGNLKGQVLEITVQSLSETIASLKEKISGEIQLPANKQKLSGKAGFLKDNLSLAYCNVASGETLGPISVEDVLVVVETLVPSTPASFVVSLMPLFYQHSFTPVRAMMYAVFVGCVVRYQDSTLPFLQFALAIGGGCRLMIDTCFMCNL
ncbi:hypothetical protein RND71_034400 [Anisodus tanguticus]|uniref:Splicing factor 3A subunit 1 n=1 Tax=Anisodus tanguticus TaxID=243964 RepID=A0AAE1RA44_9SOLA|nr:hypothetical protein RND71_034400 [Anisodus tanguticus]